jgi:hypothetical protein
LFRIASIIVCLAGLLGLAGDAFAQTPRPERPYRGLFGGGEGGASPQSLNANASFGGGWDDNILLDLPGASPGSIDPRLARSGTVGSFEGSLVYSMNKDRGSFGASLGSSTRYYPNQSITFVNSHGASVGGATRFGQRTSLSGNSSVGYQPYTFTSLFPLMFDPVAGALPVPTLDLATTDDAYLSLTSNVSLSHQLSQRTTFSAGFVHQQSDTAYSGNKFSTQGGNAGLRFGLTRSLGLRLGYGYREGRYSGRPDPIRSHYLDAGIDFNKALSFSRRTTLAFATGTTAVSDGTTTTYQAIGNARLQHELGRTWMASVSYDRSVQFLDAFLLPVFYDSVAAGVGGLVNRRVELQSSFRASIGTVGVGNERSSSDFDTYQAMAGVNVSLNRFMQFGVNYSFFHYSFDDGTVLPPGVVQSIDRRSIRAQLNLWAPIVRSRR